MVFYEICLHLRSRDFSTGIRGYIFLVFFQYDFLTLSDFQHFTSSHFYISVKDILIEIHVSKLQLFFSFATLSIVFYSKCSFNQNLSACFRKDILKISIYLESQDVALMPFYLSEGVPIQSMQDFHSCHLEREQAYFPQNRYHYSYLKSNVAVY